VAVFALMRGWAASQARVALEVWLDPLSVIRWMRSRGSMDPRPNHVSP